MANNATRAIVRKYLENGVKVAFTTPANVKEFLGLLVPDLVAQIDFTDMVPMDASFIAPTLRKTEGDIVLRARLLDRKGRRTERNVYISIMIEHQSEPDELMAFRMLDYLVQIYRNQLRDGEQAASHQGRRTGFRFQPVVPILFYTGRRSWDRLGTFADLVERAEVCAPWLPALNPLFFNLCATDADRLTSVGKAFGQLLRLLQDLKGNIDTLQTTLREVVVGLTDLVEREPERWAELLTLIAAMVYHEHRGPDYAVLNQTIQRAIPNNKQREVNDMVRTATQEYDAKLREEGFVQGFAQGEERAELRVATKCLTMTLQARFPDVTKKTLKLIAETKDSQKLLEWLQEVNAASRLEDLSFVPKKAAKR